MLLFEEFEAILYIPNSFHEKFSMMIFLSGNFKELLLFIPNFMMISLDVHAIFSFDVESHVP